MTVQAVLYVNTAYLKDGEQPPALPCPLAQLIACRVYAAARGFDVKGAHVNWRSDPEAILPTLCSLLDQLMPNGSPAADSAYQVVVVYDRSAVRLTPPDKIESLLGRHDVQVESVRAPHVVPAADTSQDRAYRMFLRGLFGQPTLGGAPRAVVVEDEAAELPSCDPAQWAALLALLGSESRVRAVVRQEQLAAAGARAHWLARLAEAREQEAAAHKEWDGLLDLLLDDVIDSSETIRRAGAQRVKADALAVERRRAHALADSAHTARDKEQLIVEIALGLHQALEGLAPAEQRRAARLLDLRVRRTPGADDSQVECSCLLPLVDESQREQVVVKQSHKLSRIVTPPLGGPDSPAEDYALAWTVTMPESAMENQL
jgi:hypothetical protein